MVAVVLLFLESEAGVVLYVMLLVCVLYCALYYAIVYTSYMLIPDYLMFQLSHLQPPLRFSVFSPENTSDDP